MRLFGYLSAHSCCPDSSTLQVLSPVADGPEGVIPELQVSCPPAGCLWPPPNLGDWHLPGILLAWGHLAYSPHCPHADLFSELPPPYHCLGPTLPVPTSRAGVFGQDGRSQGGPGCLPNASGTSLYRQGMKFPGRERKRLLSPITPRRVS